MSLCFQAFLAINRDSMTDSDPSQPVIPWNAYSVSEDLGPPKREDFGVIP